jgi:transposase-like protein
MCREAIDALTPSQAAACTALLAGTSYTEAAKAAGVSPSTLWAWRRSSAHFRTALARRRAEALERASAALVDAAAVAVRSLTEIAADPATPTGDRVRACAAILDRLGDLHAGQPGETDLDAAELGVRASAAEMDRRKLLARLLHPRGFG